MRPSSTKYRFFAYIPPKVKKSVLRRLYGGKTIPEIVGITGISKHHVNRIIDEQIKK